MSNIKFDVKNLNLHYGKFHALKDVNMEIPEKQITAFIGPSGCGKSTFLKCLNRMNDLVEGCNITGDVKLDGEDIFDGMDVNLLRKRVGMVFQNPNPFPMSVYDNIAYGPRTHGIHSKEKLDEIVERSLKQAAIWDELKDRLKKSALGLSGGQQRRVAIAGVIAMHPDFLILDEPSAGLDPIGRREIFSRIWDWYNKGVFSVILVSHNMDDIARLATRLLVMHKGKLVLDGDPMDIFLNHREELKECGVDAPPLTQTLQALKARGIPVPEDAKTTKEAIDRMAKMLGGKKSC